MESIKNILNNKYTNVNNDNKNIYINDNNDTSTNKSKYALDKDKFTPNTPETQLAEKIAQSFNDLENYAFYLKVVKNLGYSVAESFWKSHKEEEEEKKGTNFEFRNSKKYFAWKYKRGVGI